MSFEMPTQPEANKQAPEALKKGMMEAGSVLFQDAQQISSPESQRDTRANEDAQKTKEQVMESFFPNNPDRPDRDTINLKAAFESLAEESNASWEELGNMNMSKETVAAMKELAEEYLRIWRSTDSTVTKRAEKTRMSFIEKIKASLN